MIDSVPLIQNANDVQQINASIIAMKKASRELDEKIVKLNSLNSELDKKIALLDSGLNKEIEDRKEAINSLDVASVGGSGKYISAISETDGKISATVSDITSTVSSGNSQPVTSGGVADAIQGVISLPTDAVLHYSFDEVPDYPDGTAVYLRNKNFTSIETWRASSATELSIENNGLKIKSLDGSLAYIQALNTSFTAANLSNKIIKIVYKANVMPSFRLQDNGGNYTAHLFDSQSLGNNQYAVTALTDTYSYNQIFTFLFASASADNYVIISAIYIGDGSYSTPIIDNVNGQNNATNNGGIAVKGISGKGALFLENKYAEIGNFNLASNFSVSIWVNPVNNTSGKTGNVIFKNGQFIIRNGANWGNYFMVYLYGENSTLLDGRYIGSLLTPNIWSHIVCTREGLKFKVYINGNLTQTITLTDATLKKNNDAFKIHYNTNTRSQSYDDLLIFDRALTETEVMALYLNKANTPKYYDINNYNLKQIKNITAQSTDFADFQSRMAGLATRSLQLIEPTEDER